MYELRQFLCTKVELSNRGGLNLDKCKFLEIQVSSGPSLPRFCAKKALKKINKPPENRA